LLGYLTKRHAKQPFNPLALNLRAYFDHAKCTILAPDSAL